ncbi:unnamed protein product [Angiostrongylus costaricensis]|uniref:START domain-containing protein n=1 Tax=Angiostrongylus costaricensis TaxID=334426 RepID=A0A0R3PE77_ANGCS|nr:unnamed protein product [Angiostrongylus costaricensis]
MSFGAISKGRMLLPLELRHFHKFSGKSRKTGRTCGNCILPRQLWRYDVAMGKKFQREMGKRVGWDMGLEDRILLRSLGQRQRHLDQKKINQLSSILQSKIMEAVSTSEEINLSSVEFTKVKVNGSFTEVSVWWLCNGVNDEQVCFRSKRSVLSELIGVNCPEIQFKPDRSQLIIQEMDRIFRIADYGMDYRALSNTARVLGNKEEKWKTYNELRWPTDASSQCRYPFGQV